MVPGVAGAPAKVTLSVCAAELPQALLLAVTETVPPPVPAIELMLVVVELPDQVLGKVQVYEVAPFTGAIEKVSAPPVQTLDDWEMVPGVAGAVLMVTNKVCAVLLPQVPLAVTETVPPLLPVVADILSLTE